MASSIEFGLVSALVAIGIVGTVHGCTRSKAPINQTEPKIIPVLQGNHERAVKDGETTTADSDVFIDKDTGCQYLELFGSLTLRYQRNGLPACPEASVNNR